MSREHEDLDAQLLTVYSKGAAAELKNETQARASREKAITGKGSKKKDGRSLKATGRDAQINVKMKSDLKDRIAKASIAHEMSGTDFLELASELLLLRLENKGPAEADRFYKGFMGWVSARRGRYA